MTLGRPAVAPPRSPVATAPVSRRSTSSRRTSEILRGGDSKWRRRRLPRRRAPRRRLRRRRSKHSGPGTSSGDWSAESVGQSPTARWVHHRPDPARVEPRGGWAGGFELGLAVFLQPLERRLAHGWVSRSRIQAGLPSSRRYSPQLLHSTAGRAACAPFSTTHRRARHGRAVSLGLRRCRE